MAQFDYNGLEFQYEIEFFSHENYKCHSLKKMEDDIISFLFKIEEFELIVQTTTDRIKKTISETEQTIKSITMILTVDTKRVCCINFIVLTEEMAETNYKHLNKINFTDFFYKKDIQMLGYNIQKGLELEERNENKRRYILEIKQEACSGLIRIVMISILSFIIWLFFH